MKNARTCSASFETFGGEPIVEPIPRRLLLFRSTPLPAISKPETQYRLRPSQPRSPYRDCSHLASSNSLRTSSTRNQPECNHANENKVEAQNVEEATRRLISHNHGIFRQKGAALGSAVVEARFSLPRRRFLSDRGSARDVLCLAFPRSCGRHP